MTNYFLDIETYKFNGEYWEPELNTNSFATAYLMKEDGTGKIYYDKENLKKDIYEITLKNTRQRKKTIIYAHNANYEYYGIWLKEILRGEFQETRDNPLITKHKTGFLLLDTMALIGENLETIGKLLHVEKLEMPKQIHLLSELEEYNKQDCEIIRQLIIYIKKNLEEMNIKIRTLMTTPQISVNVFINHLKKEKNGYDILNITQKGCEIIKTKEDDFLRNAYHLGRCTAYQTGKHENCTMIDQNRQFPYSLTNNEIPNLRKEYTLENPLEYIKEKSFYEKYIGVCKATIKINKDYEGIGILPYNITKKDIIYLNTPNTTWTGYWTIAELKKAKENKHTIINIEKAVFYPKSKKNPFNDYFNKLYKIEQENPEKKVFIKLLMNGLIGKFGSRIENKITMIDKRENARQLISEGWSIRGEIENKFMYEKTESTFIPKYSNVMLAIHCTSQARLQMYDHLTKINNEDLLYTDTDSIMMKNYNKYKNLFNYEKQMGSFKIVEINVPSEIRKAKCYKIGKTIHVAGLSKKEQDQEVFTRIDKGEQYNMKMITLREALKTGELGLIGSFRKEQYNINKEKEEEDLMEKFINKDI